MYFLLSFSKSSGGYSLGDSSELVAILQVGTL